MARLQTPQNISLTGISTTPVQFSAVSLNVVSFVIQSPAGNNDFIKIGNATGQLFQIAPGKDLAVQGDALDNGTDAYLDLSQWYVVAVSGVQTADILYLERY